MPDNEVVRDYLGQWWLPGHAAEPIPGHLLLDSDGHLHLQLFGALEARPVTAVLSEPLGTTYDHVYGVTSRGYTLLCRVSVMSRESALFGSLDLNTGNTVQKAFVGTGEEWQSEPLFTEFAVRHSTLNAWAAMQPFQKDIKQGDGLYHVRLEYDRMVPIRLGICGPFDVTLEADVVVPAIGPGITECSVRQDLVVRLKSTMPQTLEAGLTAAAEMSRFLAFATVTETRIVSLTATAEDNAPVALPTEVLFNGLELRHDISWHPSDVLCSLEELQSTPATILSGWFERDSATLPVTELLATCTEWGNQYSWSRSVLGIQALEVYHRRTASGETELPSDVFHSAKDQALGAISDQTAHDVFAQKLHFANEPSLRSRLTQLVARAAPALGTRPDQHDPYVGLAVDTRNYYTHWDPASGRGPVIGWDLHRVSDWAELLLRALLMLDMGFAPDHVSHLLRTSRKTQWHVFNLFPPGVRNGI